VTTNCKIKGDTHRTLSVWDLIYENKLRIQNNYEIYRRRQAIVEHPCGKGRGILLYYDQENHKHAFVVDLHSLHLRGSLNLIDPIEFKQYLKALTLFFNNYAKHLRRFTALFFGCTQTTFTESCFL
jgi:hypothetical protein